MVGVIGRNGAGKSTLLRLLGGVGRPDEGSVKVRGRVGALLNLGAGFHPDLTGRENVFISGVIGGLTRREVRQRFESIVAFSELEDYVDSPLRTYSTGMQMRLAFSIAIHAQPEILLIDEVLAVGDLSFQRKCIDRIAHLKSEGCAIILVSHDTTMIEELCDEALWLRSGKLVAHGPAARVVAGYVAEADLETPQPLSTGEPGFGENRPEALEVKINRVRLLNSLGLPTAEIDSGDPLSVEVTYLAKQPIDTVRFQIYIYRDDGLACCDLFTQTSALSLAKLYGEGRIILHLEQLGLNGGIYNIDVAAYAEDWSYSYDCHVKAQTLRVRPTETIEGILRPPHRWEIEHYQERTTRRLPSALA